MDWLMLDNKKDGYYLPKKTIDKSSLTQLSNSITKIIDKIPIFFSTEILTGK